MTAPAARSKAKKPTGYTGILLAAADKTTVRFECPHLHATPRAAYACALAVAMATPRFRTAIATMWDRF